MKTLNQMQAIITEIKELKELNSFRKIKMDCKKLELLNLNRIILFTEGEAYDLISNRISELNNNISILTEVTNHKNEIIEELESELKELADSL